MLDVKKMNFDWHLKEFNSNEPWVEIDNVFTNEELDEIIKVGNSENCSLQEKNGKIGKKENQKIDTSIRISQISWIRPDVVDQQWIFKKLVDVIDHINLNYFKYDLVKIENLQFSTYTSKQKSMYKKHIDMHLSEPNFYTRKISFSLQLSEETSYEGGNLNLYYQESPNIASRKKGTLIFFPSFVLHEVTEVTLGTRHSLVGWVEGPHFK